MKDLPKRSPELAEIDPERRRLLLGDVGRVDGGGPPACGGSEDEDEGEGCAAHASF